MFVGTIVKEEYPKQIHPAGARGGGENVEVTADPEKWVAEVKYDGSRYLMHITAKGVYMTSRRISVKTEKFVEKGLNVQHLWKTDDGEDLYKKVGYCVLDGEVLYPNGTFGNTVSVMGATPVRAKQYQKENGFVTYIGFDMLIADSQEITHLEQCERAMYLKMVVQELNHKYIISATQFEPDAKFGFDEDFQKIVDNGGEGLMVKDKTAKYGVGWFKWKVVRTFDAIITGFTKGGGKYEKLGWIGAIEYGFFDPELGYAVRTGQTSGMDETARKFFSDNKEKLIGKVVEVKGQEISKKGSIRHPRFERLRDDKNVTDCTLKDALERA
mgnify:CR=1 FL=1